MCYVVHEEVRGQVCGVRSLLPPLSELWALNSCHQACVTDPLSTFPHSETDSDCIAQAGLMFMAMKLTFLFVYVFLVFIKLLTAFFVSQQEIPREIQISWVHCSYSLKAKEKTHVSL